MPSMRRPNSHFAVLTNCVPGVFVGVSSSTAVISTTICVCAGMMFGAKAKVSRPPTFENVCVIGAPVAAQYAVWLTYVRFTPVAFRSSQTVMACRSLSEPWLLITVPLAGSNSTGITSLYVNGTPIVAVDAGGFCLSIFSIGISRFWHFCMTVVDELFANQILLPWTTSHAMFPVCTTLSNTRR